MITNVDGSDKIIKKYNNGYVFQDDDDFFLNFKKVLFWSQTLSNKRKCLLPNDLRQKFVGKLYLDYITKS